MAVGNVTGAGTRGIPSTVELLLGEEVGGLFDKAAGKLSALLPLTLREDPLLPSDVARADRLFKSDPRDAASGKTALALTLCLAGPTVGGLGVG